MVLTGTEIDNNYQVMGIGIDIGIGIGIDKGIGMGIGIGILGLGKGIGILSIFIESILNGKNSFQVIHFCF